MSPSEKGYRGCYQLDHIGQPCQDLPVDPKTLARREDPVESKLAAKAIVPHLNKLHREVLDLVRRFPDRTQAELHWNVCNAATSTVYQDSRRIGRRLPELATMGRVFKSGSRKCNTTGRRATTWRVVE